MGVACLRNTPELWADQPYSKPRAFYPSLEKDNENCPPMVQPTVKIIMKDDEDLRWSHFAKMEKLSILERQKSPQAV